MKLTFTEPKIISRKYGGYFPSIMRLRDDSLIVSYSAGMDVDITEAEYREQLRQERGHMTAEQLMERIEKKLESGGQLSGSSSYWAVRSDDGGKSFFSTGIPQCSEYTELPDGTGIGLSFNLFEDERGSMFARAYRTGDNARTWEGPEYLPVTAPPFQRKKVVLSRRILPLQDGSYLVSAYGKLQGDRGDRVMLFRTTDQFQSLHYYATVAYDPTLESKGCVNEADFVRTPDGRLLCVMRSDGYLPMYQCWSDNDGATWSEMIPFGADGVFPAMVVLDNGVTVCTYGRPGVHVAFSENGGKRWSNRTCLFDVHVSNDGRSIRDREICERSCCYTDVMQIAPNRALIVYCMPENPEDLRYTDPWDNEQRQHFAIYSVEVAVER